jgi:hypothetical protein
MWWWLAAGTIVVTLIVRRLVNGSASSDIEVGGVSETWLAEQRGKKD